MQQKMRGRGEKELKEKVRGGMQQKLRVGRERDATESMCVCGGGGELQEKVRGEIRGNNRK